MFLHFVFIFISSVFGEEIYFQGCSSLGWSCVNGSLEDVTYLCSNHHPGEKYTFLLADSRLPAETKSLTLSQCMNLELDYFSPQPLTLKRLKVSGIYHSLKLVPNNDFNYHPADLVFEEIVHIAEIGSRSFRDIQAEDITFRQVNIDIIREEAFSGFQGLSSMYWEEVNIGEIINSAINLTLHNEATFYIRNSNFGKINTFSFDIRGGNLVIDQSMLDEMNFGAIKVATDRFSFTNNKVGMMMGNSLQVQARRINITNNTFNEIQSYAFSKISQTDGNSKICLDGSTTYIFDKNIIGKADEDSLDIENLSCTNELKLTNNTFHCSCSYPNWMPHAAEHKVLFYQEFLNVSSNNTCLDTPCPIHLHVLSQVKPDSFCYTEQQVETICSQGLPNTSSRFEMSIMFLIVISLFICFAK